MKKAIFLTIFTAVFIISGFTQAELQPVATVNLIRSEVITVRQLRAEVEKLAGGRPSTPQDRRQVLEVMINERLMIQGAERDKVTVSENEVTNQINQFRSQMAQANGGRQPTDAEFAQEIREQFNMDMAGLRDQIRRQMIMEKYLLSKKESLIKSVKEPTEAEIVAQYNLRRAELVRPDTVRFSIIQVPYGPDAASKTKAKELADRLVREIGANPSQFDEVLVRGQAPNSGYQAGDFGYLPRGQEAERMVGKSLMDTAFSLKQGEVSRLIEGLRSYNIIKVTETYNMKILELGDIDLRTRITVRDYIKQLLSMERQQAVVVQASQEVIEELRKGRVFQIIEANLNW